MNILEITQAAKSAARGLATTSVEVRNRALLSMAEALLLYSSLLMKENAKDLEAGRAKGLSKAMLDRLALSETRIGAMAEGLRQIAALPDPIGQIISGGRRANGLEITRVRVPLGVIGIIYESRPNVTSDATGLCLKSGNAVILRGGSEAIYSNTAIARVLIEAGEGAGLPPDSVQLIETTDREVALELIRAEGKVDVLITRGGESLKKFVNENARVPVLTALGGNCHTYIDRNADLIMAQEIAFNAKVSRPSVCNAMETLLVHQNVAAQVLPSLLGRLQSADVEVRACAITQTFSPGLTLATEEDYANEFLALTLAVRVVGSFEEALDHISRYGTQHSEAIVTGDYATAERFLAEVDAACVYVNASTRFTDGAEFGQGAEVGISTQKLHARGPIGVNELTTYKTLIRGNGQIRE